AGQFGQINNAPHGRGPVWPSQKTKTPHRRQPVRGLVSSLTLPEGVSGVREVPAPAARKEQLANRQQQGKQQRSQRSRRYAAHGDLCFGCHGSVPGLNAKGRMMCPIEAHPSRLCQRFTSQGGVEQRHFTSAMLLSCPKRSC